VKVDGTLNTDPLAQQGMPNGLDNATLDVYTGKTGTVAVQTFSSINGKLINNDDPYMLMDHAEAEFLMAEAIIRGIGTVPGTPEAHYAAGVKSAMQMYDIYDATLAVTDGAVASYLAAYPLTGSNDAKLEMIGTQMWISKFLNWWDSWSDWRRTGYPVLTPTNYPGNLTNGQIPTKLKLPTTEYTRNADNLAGATTPDTQVGKVWWDGGN